MHRKVMKALVEGTFPVLFLIIAIGLHAYTLTRLAILFGVDPGFGIATTVGLLSLSYLIAAILEKRIGNALTRGIYTVASVWLGSIFFLFLFTVVCQAIDWTFRTAIPFESILIIAMTVLICAVSIIHEQRIRVKEVKIHISGLKKPIRAVQLTDIHVGTIHNKKRLAHIVSMVNRLQPELIFITGDLVDGSGPLEAHMFDPLKELHAPAFFSVGNHEFYEGIDTCLDMIRHTGLRVLRGQGTVSHGIQVVGIDYSHEKDYAAKVLAHIKLDPDLPAILLNHTPEGFEAAERHGFDLMLSGHTHNGQVFPFNVFVKPFHRYLHGMYHLGKANLYVSPGTGTWGPPMRLGSTNEVTLLKLVPMA